MLKTFYVILVAVVCPLCALAQREIKFDFKTKKLTNPKGLDSLNKGDLFQIKIANINPYLYDVQLIKKDCVISVGSTPPLMDIFNTEGLTKIGANLSELLGKISQIAIPSADPKIDPDSSLATHTKFFTYEEANKVFDKKRTTPSKPKLTADSLKIISTTMQSALIMFQQSDSVVYKITDSVQQYVMDAEAYLLRTKIWITDKQALEKYGKGSPDLEKLKTDGKKIIDMERDYINKTNTLFSNYVVATGIYSNLIKKTPQLDTTDKVIRKYHTQLLAFSKAFDTTFNYAKISKLRTQLLNLELDVFNYTSLPIHINGDYSNVTLNIVPKDSTLQGYSTNFNFPLKQKRFWGFSTGFYGAGLVSELYSSKRTVTGTDTSYTLVKENTGQPEIGVTAMVHYGWRICSTTPIYLHIGAGPALSLEKEPKPRMAFGLGLAIGENNKVLFTLGCAFGQSKVLSKAYSENESYKDAPTDVTIAKNKASYFFSINYIFLNK